MTTLNAKLIMEVPGRLIWNPTDLTAAFPHGGSALGTLSKITVEIRKGVRATWNEESGRVPLEYTALGDEAIVAALLMSFDREALGIIFPGVEYGGASGQPVVLLPSDGSRRGDRLSDQRGAIMIAPDNPVDHPCAILWSTVPMIDDTARLAWSIGTKWGAPAMFRSMYDPRTGAGLSLGLLRDLADRGPPA